MLAFSAFAVFSFYQGMVGQSSCGCFGRLTVNPWVAFGQDLTVMAGLGLGHPSFGELRVNPRSILKSTAFAGMLAVAGVFAFSAVLLGAVHVIFGSVPAGVAFFRGERVTVDPAVVDVGKGDPGTTRTVTVVLRNWSDESVRVFGGTANCSCTVLADLPVTIPAHAARSLEVSVRLKGSPGVFTRRVAFLTTGGGLQRADFTLTGVVEAPARGSAE